MFNAFLTLGLCTYGAPAAAAAPDCTYVVRAEADDTVAEENRWALQ